MNHMRRRRTRTKAMPEISLTPLIDTVLVLLVIFMVATPMMHNSLNIDLPKGEMKEGPSSDEASLIVTIDAQNELYLNKERLPLDELCRKLAKLVASSKVNRVFVNCDKNVTSGVFVKVIDAMKYVAGVEHVVLPTEKA